MPAALKVSDAGEAVAIPTPPPRLIEPRRSHSRAADLLTRDIGLTITVALSLCLSVASFIYFYRSNLILGYGDTESRLLIASAVLDARHPGLAQLGAVWLPFPQAYMLAFVWNKFLLYTGIAGAIPSMVSYVVASTAMYKLVTLITRDWIAGLISVIALSGPNFLYLGSVPMSELPLIACIVSAVYFGAMWMEAGQLRSLFLSALSVCLGTLTRYEAWVVLGALTLVLLYVCWRSELGYAASEGYLVFFGLVAFLGVGLWLIWNGVIFGQVFYFLHSQYGTKALNAIETQGWPRQYRTVGNLELSARVITRISLDNLGWMTAGLAVLGGARLVWSGRLKPTLVLVSLLAPIPFSILMAYTGGEVIAVPAIMPGLEPANLRYGVLALPVAAFLVGWLAQGKRWRWPVLIACLASWALVWQTGQVNVAEARTIRDSTSFQATTAAGTWLRQHYDGGLILAGRPSHENLLFKAQIPQDRVVDPGDHGEWTDDLGNPQREIQWLVMTGDPPDEVWEALHGKKHLTDNYRLVYQRGAVQIYHRKAT